MQCLPHRDAEGRRELSPCGSGAVVKQRLVAPGKRKQRQKLNADSVWINAGAEDTGTAGNDPDGQAPESSGTRAG